MFSEQVTLCLTVGRRPDLLAQTLASLRGLPPLPVLAINDFGDEPTNAVFRDICPEGRLIQPGRQLGHHGAVDAVYREVATPYIFHGEDDWQFHRTDFLDAALRLLKAEPQISCVCLRDTDDIPALDSVRAQIKDQTVAGISFQRVDHLHDQWYGYGFNPHIARKALWQRLGGFSQFAKERHISRQLRAEGCYVAYLRPSACTHIGEGRSAFATPPGSLKKLKNWLRGA